MVNNKFLLVVSSTYYPKSLEAVLYVAHPFSAFHQLLAHPLSAEFSVLARHLDFDNSTY